MTDECMETCATRETQEELGVHVWRPTDRAVWEAAWQHRPFYPNSNVLGRLPNAVAVTGTLVTPVVGYLGPVDLADLTRRANKTEIAEVFAISLQVPALLYLSVRLILALQDCRRGSLCRM